MAKKEQKRSTRGNSTNELAQRLGSIKSTAKTTRSNGKINNSNSQKKDLNPLLARLDQLQNRSNGKANERSSDNPLAQRIRNGTSTSTSSSKKLNVIPASTVNQVDTLNRQIKSKLSKKPTLASRVTKPSKASQRNITSASKSSNISSASPTPQVTKKVLKIKNASNPIFLKIKNLEYGTTVSDLKVVLDSIGKTKIVRIKDLESGSAVAEVVFTQESSLDKAHRQLNGAIADGRKLKTEITNESEISNIENYSKPTSRLRR